MDADRMPLWRDRLDDLARSGLSVRAWCEARGIGKSQYTYWRRRLAEADATPREGAAWLPVALAPQSAPAISTLRITLEGYPGAAIDLAPGFDPDLLRCVVEALGAKPC